MQLNKHFTDDIYNKPTKFQDHYANILSVELAGHVALMWIFHKNINRYKKIFYIKLGKSLLI